MPRRKPPEDPNAISIPSLKEILQADTTDQRDLFASVDPLSLIRLVHAICSLGGMVTFWDDRNNSRLCFSLRLGSERKSYNCQTHQELERVAEDLVGKFTPSLRSHNIPPPPPPTPPKLSTKSRE